jgi:DnaJ-class molecular chaperone
MTITCVECKRPIQGAAEVRGDDIFHPGPCLKAAERRARGLIHQCPECRGAGRVKSRPIYNTDACGFAGCRGCSTCTGPSHIIGYDGQNCGFCDGDGYLATPPKPRMVQQGWER